VAARLTASKPAQAQRVDPRRLTSRGLRDGVGLSLSSSIQQLQSGVGNRAMHSLLASPNTAGSETVFAAHQNSPETQSGRRLLAHELTQVQPTTAATPRIQRQPDSKSAGGPGEKKPGATLEPMTGGPVPFSDLYSGLRLLDARLEALAKKHEIVSFVAGDPSGIGDPLEFPAVDPAFGKSLEKAEANVAALRSTLTATQAQVDTVNTAIQLVEWMDYDLTLIEKQREKLKAAGAPVRSVNALRAKYGTVLEKLLQPDAMASYQEAQRWAERLPTDSALDQLKEYGSRNEGWLARADTLMAWVDDLRKRIDAF
jgi:hypothetical protein